MLSLAYTFLYCLADIQTIINFCLQILENNLEGFRNVNPGHRIVFVQDNCPIHTARVVRDWFEDHADSIEVLQHPPCSPDLNAIENLWARMTLDWKDIGFHGVRERNVEQLTNHVNEVWTHFGHTDICQRLVESMPRRLQACIAAEGYSTKY